MSVLDACRGWIEATDEPAREAIRAKARDALAALAVKDPIAAESFDAAIAAASAATDEIAAQEHFAKLREIPPPVEPPRTAVPVPSVHSARPARRLWAHKRDGAVLSTGTVAVLAGEGGIGKTALTSAIALGVAMLPDGQSGDVSGGLFEGEGGPVLMASLEDDAGETAWRMRHLADKLDAGKTPKPASDALKRVHVLDLAGRPLFGPVDRNGAAGLYNARPGKLDGWFDLWREADRIRPRIIVVDPALSAFVGEPNAAAPVTEFLVSLAREAKAIEAGLLLVAHSTKEARRRRSSEAPDPFDPGQVSGTGAWTDRVRGVLAFTWGERPGERILAIPKANYGPSGIRIGLDTIRAEPFSGSGKGAIVGFKALGTWGDGKASSPAPPNPIP